MKETGREEVFLDELLKVRVGHLLRINSYLDWAILSMWALPGRAGMLMGMAEASLRESGPDGNEEDLLVKLRELIREAREYHAADDFPAAMARMRVAQDMVALRIIALAGG